MNLFLLQLAFLFIPGFLWAGIEEKYLLRHTPQQFERLLRAFLFGATTYLTVYFIYQCIGINFTHQVSDNPDNQVWITEFADEIIVAIILAPILAITWLYIGTYKLVTRFLHKIAATKRYGDEDVWDYIFNSGQAFAEYVHVRDHENELTYAGWVVVFSDNPELRELCLRDVEIFRTEDTSIKIETPRLYIALKPDKMNIEFPYKEDQE